MGRAVMTSAGARARLLAVGPQGLCLDYANTRCWRGLAQPKETLQRPADLLAWCRRAGLRPVPARLRAPAVAGLFAEAICLREVIYSVFSALATGTTIAAADLSALNAAIGQAAPRAHIAPFGAGYAWQVDVRIGAAAVSASDLLSPVIWSAADLLVAARAGAVRQCAENTCRWLFLDQSRNAARRWCDMGSCGNRAKARRHYRKRRAA